MIVQLTDVVFIRKRVYNQKRSIISVHVLMVEASKLNTYAKRHKWIDTIKHFQ